MKAYLALFGIATIAVAVLLANSGTSSEPAATNVFMVESVVKPTTGAGGVTKAVEFTWKEGNRTVSFSEYTKGKVVLLNIWATWCGPCKREIPDLVAISNEMASKGVLVVGVSVDHKENKFALVKTLVEKMSIPYLNIVDNLMIADSYGGIQSIPTSFIIDRNGNVVQRIVGGQSKEAFMAAIQRAM